MPGKLFVHSSPIHLNGDLFCAIDTETTGLDPYENSVIELCILPLKSDYTINKSILPFNMLMKPIPGKKIEMDAMTVNKLDITKILTTCLDAYKVADLLVEWFEKLGLPTYKRIVPIAQNWPFDSGFLISWLGRKTYDLLFARHFRDTMSMACSLNDMADMRGEKIPFPKVSLGALSKRFGIVNPDPHRALGDCVTTAAVYKQLLKFYDMAPNSSDDPSDVVDAAPSVPQPGNSGDGSVDGGRTEAHATV
jgi:DNA polymerase III epsilon subunit-like protein